MADNLEMEVQESQESRELGTSLQNTASIQVDGNSSLPLTIQESGADSELVSRPVQILTVRVAPSDPSEFSSSDEREDFEVTSSAAQISSDEPENMEVDGVEAKRKKTEEQEDSWGEVLVENTPVFEFSVDSSLTRLGINQQDITPLLVFNEIITEDLINLIVNETNCYSHSKYIKPGYHKDFLCGWTEVTSTEMREYIALLVFMNSRKYPVAKCFWSTDRELAHTPVAGYVMTETRFQRLTAFLHFGENGAQDYSKINNLLDPLNANFLRWKKPIRTLFVEKRTLYLREPKNGTSPKYGQIVMRLIDNTGYIYKVGILPSRNGVDKRKKKAILKLLEECLDEGRIITFNDINVSVDLAESLMQRKTYLVGPLSEKSKDIPEKLRETRLRHNDLKGVQNKEGVAIYKWSLGSTDRYALSSFHTNNVNFMTDYKDRIAAGEVSALHTNMLCPVNYDTTWYRKLAIDLIVNTAVSNAYYMYKYSKDERSYSLYDFQDTLWTQMVGFTWLLPKNQRRSSEESSDY